MTESVSQSVIRIVLRVGKPAGTKEEFEPSFWVEVSFLLGLGCDIGHDKGADILQDAPYIGHH